MCIPQGLLESPKYNHAEMINIATAMDDVSVESAMPIALVKNR
jgi:hypothetical protein